MSRIRGGRCVTTRPSMTMSPSVGSSIPAIIRRRVVLPHPEGPRRTRNSPSFVARSTWSTACTFPNSFDIPRISTHPMVAAAFRLLLECAREGGGIPPTPPGRSELDFPPDQTLLAPLGEDGLGLECGLLDRLLV